MLIPAYEGTTRKAWGYFAHFYRDEERITLNQEWTNSVDNWASRIVDIAIAVAKRVRTVQLNSRYVVCSVLIGGLVLAGWFAIFSSHSLFQFLGAAALIAMAGLASICGTVLRGILNSLGALRTRWSQRNLILEGLGGMLVTFGLFCLSEIASFALHGTPIPTDTESAIQRVGLTMSGVSFFSSLFLEDAWNHLVHGQVIIPKS